MLDLIVGFFDVLLTLAFCVIISLPIGFLLIALYGLLEDRITKSEDESK